MTLASCLPKTAPASIKLNVNPKDLRFLISRGNTYYIELGYDREEVMRAFDAAYSEFPPDGFGVPLAAGQQAWVLERCKEKIGDTFSCLYVLRGKTMLGHIKSIASYAEGGEGDVGFVGVLDCEVPEAIAVSDDIFGEQHAGVAYPAAACPEIAYKDTMLVGGKKADRVQAALRSQLGDESCLVLSAIENPRDGAILAIAEHKRTQFLGHLADGKTSWSAEDQRGTSVFYSPARNATLQLASLLMCSLPLKSRLNVDFLSISIQDAGQTRVLPFCPIWTRTAMMSCSSMPVKAISIVS